MKTSRFLIFGVLAAAAILLLTSDRAEGLRNDIADNAGKWKDKLNDLAGSAGDKLSDLRDSVSKEVDGLTKDARMRIMAILDESTKTAKNIKNKAEELA